MKGASRWALVVVFTSKAGRVVVNVFGYATEQEAMAHLRRTKKEFKEGFSGEVIAVRVRPIIDDEFIAEENAKAAERAWSV
jgi:hypothetical protein